MPLTLPSSSGPPQTPTSKLHTLNETLQSLRTQLALALPATTTAPVSLPLAAPLQAEGGSREIDARAKEIVDKHLAMLHDLNETRDAVEVSPWERDWSEVEELS